MKKLVLVTLALSHSLSVFAQTQESRLPVTQVPRATPEFAQAPIRMEPSLDLFSGVSAGYHMPRLTLAPISGVQAEWTYAQSSAETEYKDGDKLVGSVRRGFLSAAVGFGAGFAGFQVNYLDAGSTMSSTGTSNKNDRIERGTSEPNLTLGARFGSYETTVLASIDYSPKIGSTVSSDTARRGGVEVDERDNRRGGSLTIPRLTAIFNTGTAKVGGQLGYAWFGASEFQSTYDAGPARTYRSDSELKVVKASLFSEGAIGRHKIGGTLGYAKIDTARQSTWALEAYSAVALNRNFAVIPALNFSTRGTEGDMNDIRYEIWSGTISARASF